MIKVALLCLALNIYHEARGGGETMQVAVAAVTMNRVQEKESSKTICSIVYEPSAFSWTKRKAQVREKEAFIKAKKVAYSYLNKKLRNPIGSRKYFNHVSLGKRYYTKHKPIRIGNMLFY